MALGHRILLAAAITVASTACSEHGENEYDAGVDAATGVPVEFDSTWCKTLDGDPFDGLRCIGWDWAEGTIEIRLVSFPASCTYDGMPSWGGSASTSSEGVLDLLVSYPTEAVSVCGDCFYDWTFSIEGITGGEDLDLAVWIKDCTVCNIRDPYSATLPLSTDPSGIVCRYPSWVSLTASTWGNLHMPCCTEGIGGGCTPENTPCAGDLVCGEASPADDICLQPCTLDRDCAVPEVETCQEGLCLLAHTW